MLLTQTVKPWPEAKLAFFEIVIPIILCLAGSVTYHTMMANHQHYHRWLFIDVCRLSCSPSITCLQACPLLDILPASRCLPFQSAGTMQAVTLR